MPLARGHTGGRYLGEKLTMTKKTETQIVPAQPTEVAIPAQTSTPDAFALIAMAVQKGTLDIETIKELRALQKEMKADAAREAYVAAMAAFQSECPTVDKTKKVLNKDGTVRYVYAPLDVIVTQVRPILGKHGLSYSIEATQTPEGITATCKVTHILGHTEQSSFTAPVDKDGYMTAPQKVASALTYAKRYAFTNVLGILTGDEDTDATDVKKEKEPVSVKARIVFLLRQLGAPTKTKEEVEQAVLAKTQLPLIEANYNEIQDRLALLVEERNSDTSTIE